MSPTARTTPAWDGSDRRSRLPRDWTKRRAAVKARAGGRCEALMADGYRCKEAGTDCDHIQHGDDHSLGNLQWLCRWHHSRKSSAEGNAARSRPTSKRPTEQHPGLA